MAAVAQCQWHGAHSSWQCNFDSDACACSDLSRACGRFKRVDLHDLELLYRHSMPPKLLAFNRHQHDPAALRECFAKFACYAAVYGWLDLAELELRLLSKPRETRPLNKAPKLELTKTPCVLQRSVVLADPRLQFTAPTSLTSGTESRMCARTCSARLDFARRNILAFVPFSAVATWRGTQGRN
jgi:hypothetical protein